MVYIKVAHLLNFEYLKFALLQKDMTMMNDLSGFESWRSSMTGEIDFEDNH